MINRKGLRALVNCLTRKKIGCGDIAIALLIWEKILDNNGRPVTYSDRQLLHKTGMKKWVLEDCKRRLIKADIIIEVNKRMQNGSHKKGYAMMDDFVTPRKEKRSKEDRLPAEDIFPIFGQELTEKDVSLAKRMANDFFAIIKLNGRWLRRSLPPMKTWTRAFSHLLTFRDEKQVTEAVEWYRQNINEKFTPQLYSAVTFCEQFYRIESAMNRLDPKKEKLRVWEEKMRRQHLKTYGAYKPFDIKDYVYNEES